ncbi:MAG: GDP-mannose 4,6-dehydratase [Rhodospirillales bacterium]|nr:GDP-mannose 4,6-dehydratase [Rhodospirillales bacterium]MCB9979875.1 GDP-mannose 4,6-dehydratase [Rhodospirillales bacterium]
MILLTGAAGFIGFHTIQALLAQGEAVIGVDCLNTYYDPALKQARLAQLQGRNGFTFYQIDISDEASMRELLIRHPEIDRIIHLAAQAGVRYSIENPMAYTVSNLDGQMVMLELARSLQEAGKLKHFVYASSSSVYGGNTKMPFSVTDPVEQPVSLYAATKRSGELLTQSYAHLYRIPATGLRFFTVYGPWGRPDMAYYSFTKAVFEGQPIKVFNHGDMRRDFTWIDDIVDGILGALKDIPTENAPYVIGRAPHRLFNLGNNRSENLLDFIGEIEKSTGKTAEKVFCDMMPGDVKETYADIDASKEVFGYEPKTPISEGIPKFVRWYKEWA